MPKSKLEEIFTIENDSARLSALEEYARNLRIDFNQARKENGELSEHALAVLLHTAEQKRRQSSFLMLGFFVACIIFLIVMVLAFYFLVSVVMPSSGGLG